MSVNLLFRLLALVLFVLAALSAFPPYGVKLNELGLVAAGLACWVAATLVGDRLR